MSEELEYILTEPYRRGCEKGKTEAIDSIRGKVNDMYSGIKDKTYADDNWYLFMISVLDEEEGSND